MRRIVRALAALGIVLGLAANGTVAAAAAATTDFGDDINGVLQQTIQHSNDEQVQAIATSNVSLISDTVTGDYAQQLTGTLQNMLDHHVTSISLLNIQWGPVSIAPDATSAVVTSYETWHLVSRDGGPVDFEPARNDYTLVLDSGTGTWKIKSDVQTVGAPTPSATNTPTATPTLTPTATPTDTPTPMPTVTPTPSPGSDMAPAEPDQPAPDDSE